MFNQADADHPGQFTTLSLRDDPEPALPRAREETYVAGFARLFGGIGLVVVLALLYVVEGSAYMNNRPASIAVVFDPQNPAAHRADVRRGALLPN